MEAIFHPCKSVSILSSPCPPFSNFSAPVVSVVRNKPCKSHKNLRFSQNYTLHECKYFVCCSQRDVFDDFSSTQVPQQFENGEIGDSEELELRNKPSPVAAPNGSTSGFREGSEEPEGDEALAPFLKFFKGKESLEEEEDELGMGVEVSGEKREVKSNAVEAPKVGVEYYDPKPGEFVVGVVVSGNENKLDINVGADLLGTMLTKEVLPLYDREMEYLQCDMKMDSEEFMVSGRMGILKHDDALSSEASSSRPVVETGTVLFAEVLGRTLSGRPLLSTRRLFRRIAWHRGLRAFLPKAELLNKVYNFTELKENVGRRIHVLIKWIDEDKNDLILSEREAWEMVNLREGALLDGTVKKIFPYGAQIRMGVTNRSGLVHISNITRSRVTSVNDLFTVSEKVKVLVVKSIIPDKISLSTAHLESEPGLFLSDRERVFSEAEEMAKKYRKKLPAVVAASKPEKPLTSDLSFDEPTTYANWKWFKFEREPE